MKYYEMGRFKFKVEKLGVEGINATYSLTVLEDGRFESNHIFKGANAYAKCLAEMISYAEIDEKDFEED